MPIQNRDPQADPEILAWRKAQSAPRTAPSAVPFRLSIKPSRGPSDSNPSMQFDVNNPYFRTKVLTASKEELRLMLIEGSLRFMRSGREGLAKKNFEQVFEGFTNAKAIIMELMNTLDHSVNPELCAKLAGLYTYMFTRLTEGSLEKDLAKVDEVIGLMEYERETWVLLMEKLASERAAGRDPVAEAAAALGRPVPNAPSGAAPAPFTPNFAQPAPGEARPSLSLSA